MLLLMCTEEREAFKKAIPSVELRIKLAPASHLSSWKFSASLYTLSGQPPEPFSSAANVLAGTSRLLAFRKLTLAFLLSKHRRRRFPVENGPRVFSSKLTTSEVLLPSLVGGAGHDGAALIASSGESAEETVY